jgi:hypothetical protein
MNTEADSERAPQRAPASEERAVAMLASREFTAERGGEQ